VTANARVTKTRPGEILTRMGVGMFRDAYERGLTLSAHLEREDPSSEYNDGTDAFQRLMEAAGIITRSQPGYGVYSDRWEAFESSEAKRALGVEWMNRTWRRAAHGLDQNTRALYASADQAPGSPLRPFVDAAGVRYQQIQPAIPLDELVAATTPIDGDAYRAVYLNDDTTQEHMVRVAEGTEVPRVKLTAGTHTTRLRKYGRSLEMTYEQMRRMRIDLVAIHIARLAVLAESDKVAQVIDTLVNGDGNSGTSATPYSLSALDALATIGKLSLPGWLSFKLKFLNPYSPTTLLAQEGSILQTQLLNTGTANIPLVNIQAGSSFGGFRQINPTLSDDVAYGVTPAAPAGKLLVFDKRFAIERVTEIGANITETERFVTRQTQAIVMTEVEGYNVFDPHAVKLLDLGS